MASLLNSLGQTLSPQTMNTIGSALGLDSQMMQQGLDVVGPLVAGGLAGSVSTPQGLDSLMQILQPPADGAPGGLMSMLGGGGGGSSDMLGSLLSAATGAGGQAGGAGDLVGALLNGLFGAGAVAAIGAQLDKALGFKVSPLLVLVAPLLLKQLQKVMTEQKLDANGVANLLQERTACPAGHGGGPTGRCVAFQFFGGRVDAGAASPHGCCWAGHGRGYVGADWIGARNIRRDAGAGPGARGG